jgi:hypothetical protein
VTKLVSEQYEGLGPRRYKLKEYSGSENRKMEAIMRWFGWFKWVEKVRFVENASLKCELKSFEGFAKFRRLCMMSP